ncbi:MAG: thioredoxin domain-containing protein [Patescibacteria group bacterium]
MLEVKKLEVSPSFAIIITGVIIAGAIIFVGKFPAQAGPNPSPQQGAEAPANVSAPTAQDHRRGSPNAPIVLIEYSDFQCPFCQRIDATLQRIVDESQGQIAWVYRHFPLESIHPEARPAALASECIAEQLGNDGFWKFADAVFADQQSIGAAQFTKIAADLGANAAQFASCTASEKYGSKVDAEANEAQLNGGSGTPYTIVYGYGQQKPFSGALPYAQIKAVISSVQNRQ